MAPTGRPQELVKRAVGVDNALDDQPDFVGLRLVVGTDLDSERTPGEGEQPKQVDRPVGVLARTLRPLVPDARDRRRLVLGYG
jgi:hypothetical protein